MKDNKYTAVDDKFLEEVLDLIESRDLYDKLSDELQDKFDTYKKLKNE